jgi:hypothetical protein
MRFLFTLLLVCVLQDVEPQRHQFDLEDMLRDPGALQRLKIHTCRQVVKVIRGFLFTAMDLRFGKHILVDRCLWR